MAVTETTIQGKVRTPGGVATGGTIKCSLIGVHHLDDGGTEHVIMGFSRETIASDGSVSFTLPSNDTLTPAGSYYRFDYEITGPIVHEETKNYVVNSSPSTQDIGDLPEYGGAVAGNVQGWLSYDGTIAAFEAAYPAAAGYRNFVAVVRQGSSLADYELRCLKNSSDTYEWVVVVGAS